MANYRPVGDDFVRPTPPRLGRIAALEVQAGISEGALELPSLNTADPIDFVDVSYEIRGGAEHGRGLTGAVRTFLRPDDTSWASVERLAASHVLDRVRFDTREVTEPVPDWERVVVRVDGTKLAARYSICSGYEAVAFRAGDRIVSSVFSVFDASLFDSSFRTFIWPRPTA
ncbi:hypothetical protein D6T64_08300 [Cryobacterium melibiosiphilum]|uniref:Uncharacterized protein n=1 Tax=Cryobacterium melibiosiphilum TaxID=995039 RepID=A0A3A5MG36_9MICO|nr:hypothetical protein [Cryobacterium melibiosiphilum]RJT89097.1 hypothetical protein D6T64_08300 [Cryobacterium melibiosiphilum]